jgi:hypothetical protein
MISTLLLTLCMSVPQCPDFETTLYAGQDIAIGTVSVSNTSEQLVIDIDVPFPWFFAAYHIYAGVGPVPTNGGGNVAPGQFPFSGSFINKRRSYTVVLEDDDLGVSLADPIDLVIAVHLDAFHCSNGQISQSETAWAFGTPFNGNQWGWSFTYTTCSTGSGDRSDLALDVDQLTVGETSTLTAAGADEGETVFFAYNCGSFACGAGIAPPRLGGLLLDLDGHVMLAGNAIADAGGLAELDIMVPITYAGRVSDIIGMQAAIIRGTNGADSVKSNVRLLRLAD